MTTGITDINFNEVDESYFLSKVNVTKRVRNLLSFFTHKDTQERENGWRVQGSIKIDDFINCLDLMSISLPGLLISKRGDELNLTFCL